MPGAAALCACLAIVARPAPDLGRLHALAVAAIFATGIAYYNAVLLAIAPLVAIRWYIRLCLQPEIRALQRLVDLLTDLAPAIAVAALAFIALFLMRGPGSASTDLLANLAVTGQGITHGVGAAIAGASGFTDYTDAPTALFWGIIGAALLFAIVGVGIIRSPSTTWLWAGCFAFIAVQLWIIGSERTGTFGPWVVTSARYNLSNVLVFTAAAIIAFSPRYPARTLIPAGPMRPAAAIAAGLALLAIVASNIATGLSLTLPVEMQTARDFAARLRATAPASHITVGDRTLPNAVTPQWTGGYASLAAFATISPVHLDIVPWRNATHMIADDGALVPIATLPIERWTWPDGVQRDIRILPPLDAAGELTLLEHGGAAEKLSGWSNPLIRAHANLAQLVAITPDAVIHVASAYDETTPAANARFRASGFDTAGFTIPLAPGTPVSAAQGWFRISEMAATEIEVETEVFVFGGLCVMAEGRCSLSSYATGQSPNTSATV